MARKPLTQSLTPWRNGAGSGETSQMPADQFHDKVYGDAIDTQVRGGVPGGARSPGMVAFRVTGTEQGERRSIHGAGYVAEAGVVTDEQGHLFHDGAGLQQCGPAAKVDTG